MNSTQAREILTLYRPGTDDPASQEFAQALSLARSDSELKVWFDQHCAAYEAVRGHFRSIVVPEGLKEQILSERKVRTTKAFRRTVSLYASVATLFILMAGLAIYYSQRPTPIAYAYFQAKMAGIVERAYPKMDLETSDLGKIREFLKTNQANGDYVMPPGLAKTTSTGCAVLHLQGKTVSMVCFRSGLSADPGPDLYLFVINRASVSGSPPAGQVLTAQQRKLALSSWSSGDKTYLLAGEGDAEFLKKFE